MVRSNHRSKSLRARRSGGFGIEPMEHRLLMSSSTSWKSPVSGNWNDAALWTHGVPTKTTAASISVAGSYTVTVSDTETAASLTLAQPLVLGDGAMLSVADLDLTSTLTISADNFLTTLNLVPNPATLAGPMVTGNGQIVMAGVSPADDQLQNYGRSNAKTVATIGSGITVSGGGYLLGNFAGTSFVNQGTITANLPGQTLYLTQPVTNDGSFLAPSGVLAINYNANGSIGKFTSSGLGLVELYGQTLDLAGGTLSVNATTGSLGLAGSTIENGTLNANGGASFFNEFNGAVSGALNDITLGTDLTIPDSAYVTVTGTLTLTAGTTLTIDNDLSANQGSTFLGLESGSSAINGTGTILFAGVKPAGGQIGNDSAQSPTIGSGITIRGGGDINDGTTGGGIINDGTLVADTAGETLSVTGTGLFTNNGTLEATAGTLNTTGTAYGVPAATVHNAAGGIVEGTGTIVGNLTNAGVIAGGVVPGSTTFGTLTLSGNLIQTTTGSIRVNLDSTTDYNRLVVTGSAALAGILDAYTVGNFKPAIGSSFSVFSCGSKTGSMGSDGTSLGNGVALSTVVTSTGESLKAITAPVDTKPPTVSSFVVTAPVALAKTVQFSVTYADNIAVEVSSLSSSNIEVTGPGGFTQLAKLVSISKTNNGTPRTAVYSITPTIGRVDVEADGVYTVKLLAGSVKDTRGNAAAAGTLGTFTIAVEAKLVFTTQPSNVAPGKAISPAVVVKVEDAEGNVITTGSSTVKLSLATAPAGATLGGVVSVSTVSGVATFKDLLLGKGGSYSLKAVDGVLATATSSVFAVS